MLFLDAAIAEHTIRKQFQLNLFFFSWTLNQGKQTVLTYICINKKHNKHKLMRKLLKCFLFSIPIYRWSKTFFFHNISCSNFLLHICIRCCVYEPDINNLDHLFFLKAFSFLCFFDINFILFIFFHLHKLFVRLFLVSRKERKKNLFYLFEQNFYFIWGGK